MARIASSLARPKTPSDTCNFEPQNDAAPQPNTGAMSGPMKARTLWLELQGSQPEDIPLLPAVRHGTYFNPTNHMVEGLL